MAEQIVNPSVLPTCDYVFGSGVHAIANGAYAAWREVAGSPDYAADPQEGEAAAEISAWYDSEMDARLHHQREIILMRARADAWDQLRLGVIDAQFRLSPRRAPAIFGMTPDQPFTDWLANVSTEQLRTFMNWNEFSLREPQERLRRQVQAMHGPLLQRIGNLTAQMVVPPETPVLIGKALKTTTVHILDPLAAGSHLCIAECYPAEHRIGISELAVDQPDLAAHATHEYMHQAAVEDGGADLTWLYSDVPRKGTGLASQNTSDSLTWLDEAVIEHLAEAAWHGDVHVFNPLERSRWGMRVLPRVLASLLHDRAARPISAQMALWAYFDRTPKGACRRHYREQIAAGWEQYLPEYAGGDRLLRTIARSYNEAPTPEMQEQTLVAWIGMLASRSNTQVPNLSTYLADSERKVYGVPYGSIRL